ncbi:MAG: winged helix-turn-helix transcriptional regulator [Geminicoccaceae bacterium]
MSKTSRARGSGCPICYSLDIFGDRWTLLILRDLLLAGKQRYREFLASDEAIASNILSDRLRRLEAADIILREPDPNDRRQLIYRATDKGQTLLPVLLEIAAWGASNDLDTGAPPGFAQSFYANREAFHADHAGMMAKLGKGANVGPDPSGEV